LFDLVDADKISVEDALRNADSVNDLRLAIKLHAKNSQGADTDAAIEGLDII
jgi:twitching motility protein PilU